MMCIADCYRKAFCVNDEATTFCVESNTPTRYSVRTVKARDTDDKANQAQIAALRALGMEGRLRRGIELSDGVRAMTEAGIRQRHPTFTEQQVRHELLRICYGEELANRVAAAAGRSAK